MTRLRAHWLSVRWLVQRPHLMVAMLVGSVLMAQERVGTAIAARRTG